MLITWIVLGTTPWAQVRTRALSSKAPSTQSSGGVVVTANRVVSVSIGCENRMRMWVSAGTSKVPPAGWVDTTNGGSTGGGQVLKVTVALSALPARSVPATSTSTWPLGSHSGLSPNVTRRSPVDQVGGPRPWPGRAVTVNVRGSIASEKP